MMKKSFLLIVFILAGKLLIAADPLSKGENQLNIGVGLSSWGIPVYIGFDHGMLRNLTLGGEISFRSYNEKISSARYRHSVVGIAGNGNYHLDDLLNLPDEWNVYAGLNLGFYIYNSPTNYVGPQNSGLGFGAQAGARYYFSRRIGANLEFGGGNAFGGGKLGITVKL